MQLRRGERLRCALFCGEAARFVDGKLGPIAIFEPHAVVGYRIEHGRRVRAFVFRTLEKEGCGAVQLPGVRPEVRLLVDVRTAGRARRLAKWLSDLARRGRRLPALPEVLYLRVSLALGGRAQNTGALESLLRRQEAGLA